MLDSQRIAVIIPARNEATALPHVLPAIPKWVDEVIVADNGSTDQTAAIAQKLGAAVVCEKREGYGYACQTGIDRAASADILVFLDGDRSDYPEQMTRLVDPIVAHKADMVIGSRVLGRKERGALTVQQRFGNALACFLVHQLWGYRYTDLGPFRAIRRTALVGLHMQEMTYGWTVEMQIKALQKDLRVHEAPVDYRRRIGVSKVSGTIKGVIGAGTKILSCIGRHAFSEALASCRFRSNRPSPHLPERPTSKPHKRSFSPK